MSRESSSQNRSTREPPCLNDYEAGQNEKRDAYRRYRTSWNNEAIGGIREKHGSYKRGPQILSSSIRLHPRIF